MKKKNLFLAILTVLLIMTIALAGCSPAAEEPVVEESVAEEPAAETQEVIQVAFMYVGPVSDEGYNWSHDQGRLAVEEHFGDSVETWYIENTPFSEEMSRTVEQYIADGADMIILCSDWGDFGQKVAEAHPEIPFLHMVEEPHDNELAYYVAHEYPSYLIGMAAGLLTETNKIGYIGSFPSNANKVGINAFHLGARSVNPDITTHPVFINSWFDPAAARQAAEALADSGVDVLFGIMDEGAYLEVAEERGIWAAMWNTDIRQFGPSAYVSTVLLDWDDFYIDQVGKVLDGTWDDGGNTIILPMTGGVDRGPWGDNVPTDIQEQVDAVREKMLNDGFNPFVGPLKDAEGNLVLEEGQELSSEDIWQNAMLEWVLEGVVGLK